ncbi:MAG: hypothetical protein FWH40_00490 [Coriobacteriia bacterium]|nr:hypothetical protein [Coriobacteriia bacterium]
MNEKYAELVQILTKFVDSEWDLIEVPAKAWLDECAQDSLSQSTTSVLIEAVEQANEECGDCGCELDELYPKALELLSSLQTAVHRARQ